MTTSNAPAATATLEFPAASPFCSLKQRVGLTDITIDYSRPGVKGRDIFGGVVPYDKVWRTGANVATKIVFSTAVKLNGTEVAAGTYALMTIPAKDQWTVILNKGPEEWNTYKYDEKADVVRFKASPVQLDRSVENFTIEFNQITDESSQINLVWDKVEVPIKLEVDYVDKLTAQVQAVMASDVTAKPHFQAALFFYNHNKDLHKALKWVDTAIAERDAYFFVHARAKILAKLGDKAGAIAAAKHSSELAITANDSSYQKLNADLLATLN